MELQALLGIAIPFLGTALGSATVFFLKNIKKGLSSVLGGFAGGVMIAASVFSLLIPAIEWSAGLGGLSFLPASLGFLFGVALFLAIDSVFLGKRAVGEAEGGFMLTLAVALHNLPEGVAVGVVYAGLLSGAGEVSAAAALALAVGVGIQNFPEGAIISLPLAAGGEGRWRAFMIGVLSALVETFGAVLAIALTSLLLPLLPYLLGFAAGAMVYVVVEELIPDATGGGGSRAAALSFSLGFLVMMILDVAT